MTTKRGGEPDTGSPLPPERRPEGDGALSDDQLGFLQELVNEQACVEGDVVQVGDQRWAIYGFIPVDGEVLMAEYDSYEEAVNALGQLPRQAQRD